VFQCKFLLNFYFQLKYEWIRLINLLFTGLGKNIFSSYHLLLLQYKNPFFSFGWWIYRMFVPSYKTPTIYICHRRILMNIICVSRHDNQITWLLICFIANMIYDRFWKTSSSIQKCLTAFAPVSNTPMSNEYYLP